jgi:glycosyltransferase involved in cell wall biosynthesis
VDEEILKGPVKEKLRALGEVEIIVGIPSHNNARTIGHVVKAAQAGLLSAFPDRKALIVNSDGGSKDGTPEAAVEACGGANSVLVVEHPLYPVHHLTTPYHGLPGKGSAFQTLFRITELVRARALAVVDADLRSINSEWFSHLLQPILTLGYDYVAPYYKQDKYDGTITSGIVYPLTRMLYGRRVRQPIGGEFGISGRLASRFLTRNVWSTDVARYGIDIWMVTTAVAENFQVCQSHLGPRIHDPKGPSSDLSGMLVQVVGSVFELMATYDSVWRNVLGSLPAPLLGIPFEAGPEPLALNLDRMLASYRQAIRDLFPVYRRVISPPQLKVLETTAALPDSEFALTDELWVAVIYEFALAYHRRVIDREHLLRSLTPLYLGWVASFARQAGNETAGQVEGRIERLCQVFEQLKPYLINQWPLQTGEKRSV